LINLKIGDFTASRSIPIAETANGISFENLPVGECDLVAQALNNSGIVLGERKQPIFINPGVNNETSFELIIGGSSAMDVGFAFTHGYRDIMNDTMLPSDPNWIPIVPQGYSWIWHYTFTKGNVSRPLEYHHTLNGWSTRDFAGYTDYLNYGDLYNQLFLVPSHAAVLPDPVANTRTYTYSNIFTVNGQDVEYQVERLYRAGIGLT
jgi:hypothetical protein